MPNNTGVTSSRDRYTERMKAKYPERSFADDEELFGQINDDYDNYDKELSGYKERETALSGLFASDPRSAAFLMEWRNGEDPVTGLIRRFGDDFKAALEDPDKQEAIANANKEYADRIAEESQFEEQHRVNLEETCATIRRMQESDNLTDDDIDQAMEFLISIMRDAMLGKFTRESILMAIKATKYDVDVEQANIEGEVRGRNAKIDEQLRKSGKSDGTANLHGKNSGGKGGRRMPDLGAIDRLYDEQDIFARGGEKRIKG